MAVYREPVAPDLILIPGGPFVMGSEDGQDDERPLHEVELSPFYLSRHAVTNKEYAVFVEAGSVPPPARWDDSRFNHPDAFGISRSGRVLRGDGNQLTCKVDDVIAQVAN